MQMTFLFNSVLLNVMKGKWAVQWPAANHMSYIKSEQILSLLLAHYIVQPWWLLHLISLGFICL